MKKILIVESDRVALCAMIRIARDSSREVKGILFGENHACAHDDNILCTNNPMQAIAFIRSFNPDVTFLEHDLGLGSHLTGRYFAHELGLRRETLVGISIHDQSYCGHMMHDKKRLEQHPLYMQKFMSLLAALTSQEKAVEPAA